MNDNVQIRKDAVINIGKMPEYIRQYVIEKLKNPNDLYDNKEKYPSEFNYNLKEIIRKLNNRHCMLCGKKEDMLNRKLCVHHIDYNKKNCSIKNLISLCNSCHIKTNTNRQNWIDFFTSSNKGAENVKS
jgi:hypothetical protein